jgi:ABC-type Fe3+ transport system permease subunit
VLAQNNAAAAALVVVIVLVLVLVLVLLVSTSRREKRRGTHKLLTNLMKNKSTRVFFFAFFVLFSSFRLPPFDRKILFTLFSLF